MPERAQPQGMVSVHLARALAVLAALGLAGCVFFFWFWYTGTGVRARALADLTAVERRALEQELAARGPGIYAPALFAPELAYTLAPGQEHSAWGHTFVANEIGYRAGPVARTPDSVRILFVGDEWTFGVGVDARETFPARCESLANRFSGTGRPVEAFTLALPGYNLLNGLAALEVFLDRLQPDAVVLCPAADDIDSSAAVLPSGSLAAAGGARDELGASHAVRLQARAVDSHLFHARWRAVLAALRATEQRFAALGIPLVLYLAGPWEESLAHRLVLEGDLQSPYVVTPPGALGEARADARVDATVQRRCAGMVYGALAEVLGWRLLPPDEQGEPVPVHLHPPDGDWRAQSDAYLRRETGRTLPPSFTPGAEAAPQVVGGLDAATGVAGRAATVLVRRLPGSRRLVLSVRALAALPSLYPLRLEASVPSPAGGTQVVTSVPRDATTAPHVFELPLPDDVAAGAALDVQLLADRAGVAGDALELSAFVLSAVEQRD